MALSRKEKLVVAIVLVHTFLTREVLKNLSTMSVAMPFGLGAYLIAIAFLTYYCAIADPSKSRLAYLFTVEWPTHLRKRASDLIGEEAVKRLKTLADHFPAVLYVIIVFSSWAVVFFFTFPWIDASEGHVSSYHKTMAYIVFIICVTSWRLACKQSPGIITADTLEKYDNYPYDGLLFVKDRICPTVGIPKLARSKYDRHSGVHVSKFDHFCGWLGNPIGEENYRWFLLFLLVHAAMLTYGAIVVAYLFQYEIEKLKLWDVVYINRVNGEEFKATPYVIFQYLFPRHRLHAGLFLLFSLMGFVLTMFLGYHVWITSRGMTTNEASKWSEVKAWYNAELKRYNKAVKEGLVNEKTGSKFVVSDGDVTCSGAAGQENREGGVEAVQIFHPGPRPKNIYNYGLIENWRDVVYPRSLREQARECLQRAGKERTPLAIDSKQPKSKSKES